jgi:predicted transcriptional regulator
MSSAQLEIELCDHRRIGDRVGRKQARQVSFSGPRRRAAPREDVLLYRFIDDAFRNPGKFGDFARGQSCDRHTGHPSIVLKLARQCYSLLQQNWDTRIWRKALKPEVSEKLEALARETKRSKAYLASEAIAAYVDLKAWQVAHIKEALEEDDSGVPGVPHDEVIAWIESWGTDHELSQPTPKKS